MDPHPVDMKVFTANGLLALRNVPLGLFNEPSFDATTFMLSLGMRKKKRLEGPEQNPPPSATALSALSSHRRHHCRQCLKLVCSACSSNIWQLDSGRRRGKPNRRSGFKRVCDKCYAALEATREVCSRLILVLVSVSMSMLDHIQSGKVLQSSVSRHQAQSRVPDCTSLLPLGKGGFKVWRERCADCSPLY